jgi:hypothetical protein
MKQFAFVNKADVLSARDGSSSSSSSGGNSTQAIDAAAAQGLADSNRAVDADLAKVWSFVFCMLICLVDACCLLVFSHLSA